MAYPCQIQHQSLPEDIDGISIIPTLLGNAAEQKHHQFLYREWDRGEPVGGERKRFRTPGSDRERRGVDRGESHRSQGPLETRAAPKLSGPRFRLQTDFSSPACQQFR